MLHHSPLLLQRLGYTAEEFHPDGEPTQSHNTLGSLQILKVEKHDKPTWSVHTVSVDENIVPIANVTKGIAASC